MASVFILIDMENVIQLWIWLNSCQNYLEKITVEIDNKRTLIRSASTKFSKHCLEVEHDFNSTHFQDTRDQMKALDE